MADKTIVLTADNTQTVEIYDPTMGLKYTANDSNPFTKTVATAATINSIAAIEGMSQIQLLWTQDDVLDHDYTEVYRSEVNNPDTALLVGTSNSTSYTDAVDAGITYYYWLMPVSFNNVRGVLSDVHVATSGRNPERLAQAIGTALTAENISDDMRAAIVDIIDDATSDTLLALQDSISSLNIDFASVSNLASLINVINTMKAELQADDAETRALIEQQSQLLTTNETALLERMDSLSATVTTEVANREAALEEERVLRANALGVVTSDVTTLTAGLSTEVSDRIAAINNEAAARATDISSVTTQITDLIAQLNDATGTLTAKLSEEATLRVSEDSSLATTLNTLQASVTNNLALVNAAITTEAATRADDVSALSTAVTNYTTTLNGNSATITELASSIDGINANYAVKTDVNGRVAGIGLMNSGDSSSFEIVADNFAVLDPDDPTNVVIGASNGVAFIDGAYIKNASIDSASIASLDAQKINATTLSAIRADMGTITAGYMANSTGRFVIDLNNNNLKVYDAAGTLRVQLGDLG